VKKEGTSLYVRPGFAPRTVRQLAPGDVLGHYRIAEKIGEGGMGEVYRALDEHLHRYVAIKVLPPGSLADVHARKRFRKEADALSKLNHPNIATIYDFDTQEGTDFLVMEYVPGETLSFRLRQERLSEKQVIRVGLQLVDGLAAAHEQGVIHRDLKPGNLRLTCDERLKILDFGLAKLVSCLSPIADTESVLDTVVFAGTLPYMAPEQLRGAAGDVRTDIYSTGVVLYELTTGRLPFLVKLSTALTDDVLRQAPPPLGRLRPDISPRLEEIILKCLEKDPDNRYQSARELAIDLKRIERDSQLQGIAIDRVRPGLAFLARYKNAMLLVLGVLAAVGAFTVLFLRHVERTPSSPPITPSIAVLPFVDLSPQKDQEYFSDGLAEELLNSLVKIQGLHVTARTSSFQFKGKNEDLRVIGQRLNVATVLEGSVRKQGQRVRIGAQLIQVSDGFHLWSEAYDRDLTDIFAVQEEIARSVAESLRVTLLGEKAHTPRATNVEAYDAYLQGQYFYARPTRRNLEKAISYSQQAISRDPSYAPAWAVLSRARSFQAGGYGPVHEYSRAREAAERAVALDPNLAQAYLALGEVKEQYDWDWAGADASYRRALALEPGNAEVVEGAGYLAAILNHFEEALSLSRRAAALDPLRASAHHNLALIAWRAGHLDEAEAAIQKALELDPQFPWLHTVLSRVYLARSHPQEALAEAERDGPGFRQQELALAYHALGRGQESDRALDELIAGYKQIAAFQVAEVYAFRGEVDAAFTWLERAYEQRDPGLIDIERDPLLKNLERDPRYAAFLKKMRLPG
jgi:eukaryotic-like serine/threonine-protein kinase